MLLTAPLPRDLSGMPDTGLVTTYHLRTSFRARINSIGVPRLAKHPLPMSTWHPGEIRFPTQGRLFKIPVLRRADTRQEVPESYPFTCTSDKKEGDFSDNYETLIHISGKAGGARITQTEARGLEIGEEAICL